ncbi:Uncharacterised protein [Corynebacterium matruchotii]|uniref:Uncharacterized protein n=1 Tax=Corynebacterium matruchotii TaxID=43768 RepID=A0A8B4H8W0_9CORY|nr:Uncharacterised protein [Corynebacterium matruchotii]
MWLTTFGGTAKSSTSTVPRQPDSMMMPTRGSAGRPGAFTTTANTGRFFVDRASTSPTRTFDSTAVTASRRWRIRSFFAFRSSRLRSRCSCMYSRNSASGCSLGTCRAASSSSSCCSSSCTRCSAFSTWWACPTMLLLAWNWANDISSRWWAAVNPMVFSRFTLML